MPKNKKSLSDQRMDLQDKTNTFRKDLLKRFPKLKDSKYGHNLSYTIAQSEATPDPDIENLKELGPPVRSRTAPFEEGYQDTREKRAAIRDSARSVRKMFPDGLNSVRSIIENEDVDSNVRGAYYPDTKTVEIINPTNTTVSHELGHSMGLDHTNDSNLMAGESKTSDPYIKSRFNKLITEGYDPDQAFDAVVENDLNDSKMQLESDIAAMRKMGLSSKQIQQYLKNKNKDEEFTQVTDEPKSK